ncbi:diaminopimelate epimerase [Intrasporangium oryzae NRRL B-24470]|uniref:Diaminopimelate epimerase n=2 Tax=Intrasporangium TaxID=53357 RepID=W9GB79_9MICO|nr:diaminopimelate epimerase [Intrasporangium oryzae]EWT03461.1 diaminopimelate epimerase [Intrasporangium oryzae NRRL B-24470]
MTRFTKGHGTENDFVLVPDLEGTLELTPAQVQRLADRHAGLGGDGVIRVVRTEHAVDDSVRALAPAAEWFMDYRNADGSLAEMCGNGTRVFAAYLRREGLVTGDSFTIATRAGVKTIRVTPQGYAVNLGPWRLTDEEGARRDGFDIMVRPHHGKPVPALSLDLGNPHAVVMLPEGIALENLDLTEAPEIHPAPTGGANVEFVRPVGPGHISMRVHERGVGETRSCGTGAAAAALATRFWSGVEDDRPWTVDVPGGRLTVTPLPGQCVELAGPAELVADGDVTL